MGRHNGSSVGDEHRHVREAVGLFDSRTFAKYEIAGRTRRARWTGSAPMTFPSRWAGSPIPSFSTRAAASRPT